MITAIIADLGGNVKMATAMFGPTQEIHGIQNVPRYALNYRYWVYREVDGKRWFFGAWNEANKAIDVATTERGWVFDTHTAEDKEGEKA